MATIHETKDGKFVRDYSDPDQSQFVSLNTTLGRLKAMPGDPHIVIHLHGGLVPTSRGRKIAQRLAKPLPDGIAHPSYEQMSIVWGSGAFETVITNFRELASDRLFDRILKKTLQWASGRVLDFGSGVRSPGQALVPQQVEIVVNQAEANLDVMDADEPFAISGLSPESIADPGGAEDENAQAELTALLQSDNELVALSAALDAELRPQQFAGIRATLPAQATQNARETLPRLNPEFIKAYEAEVAGAPAQTRSALGTIALRTIIKQTIKAGFAIVRRYRRGRHHDFYPTVFEEVARHFFVSKIGSQVWSSMKKDTADHFEPGGAGIELLQRLNALNAVLTNGRSLRLTIVGHSAGCIFASEMLKALKASANGLNIPPVDVVFLAPAVDFQLFSETLDVVEDQIWRFTMFTMDDTHEKQDRLLGAFYPRSLLYMISGALEFPQVDDLIVGMDRFHRVNASGRKYTQKEQTALNRVKQFMADPKAHNVWSATGASAPTGAKSQALIHGDFDDDCETLESVVHLAKSAPGVNGATP